MNIVDTNVISELTKTAPNPNALAWLDANMEHAYLTCVTLYEMRHAIQRLPEGKRKQSYLAKLSDIRHTFSSRILPFGSLEAEIAGDLQARAESAGFNASTEDIMIAAIVQANNATLVTRNTRDFEIFGLELINPFDN